MELIKATMVCHGRFWLQCYMCCCIPSLLFGRRHATDCLPKIGVWNLVQNSRIMVGQTLGSSACAIEWLGALLCDQGLSGDMYLERLRLRATSINTSLVSISAF